MSRAVWASCLVITMGVLALAVVMDHRTSEGEWFRLQVVSGVFVLVLLALTILSFRKPMAKIGAGVGFLAETTAPPGYAVIEQDRLRAMNEAYDQAQESVLRLKESLRQAEEARVAAEGELQRVLSKSESSKPDGEAGSVAAPTPSKAESSEQPVVLPEPAVAGSVDPMSGIVDPVGIFQDTDEDDAEIARDLLLRLIDTEVPMAERGVDPGEVRAKLARTAARKKPGGGERRIVEEEPSEEMPPWARNR